MHQIDLNSRLDIQNKQKFDWWTLSLDFLFFHKSRKLHCKLATVIHYTKVKLFDDEKSEKINMRQIALNYSKLICTRRRSTLHR